MPPKKNKKPVPVYHGPKLTFVRPEYKPIPIINPETRASQPKKDGKPAESRADVALDPKERTNSASGPSSSQLTASNPSAPPSSQLTTSNPSAPNGHQHDEISMQPWRANVYARPFIQELLSAINTSYATVIESTCITKIDFQSYISYFAGRGFLMPHKPVEFYHPLDQAISSLTAENYEVFFRSALAIENQAEASAAISHNMYKIQLHHKEPQNGLFELLVPGLREDRPRVQLGDTIGLRQLRIDSRTGNPLFMEQWLIPGGGRDNGHMAPGFTGVQHNASVWGLDRAKEIVVLRIDGLVDASLTFNVMFRVQQRRYDPFDRTIADINRQLSSACETPPRIESPQNGTNSTIQKDHQSEQSDQTADHGNEHRKPLPSETWMRRMLFPIQSDGVKQDGLPKGVFNYGFFDKTLNYEQKKAVDSTLQQHYGGIPYLISGPPGTGKTKTIVEIALQLIHRSDEVRTHILLCAPSDPAADILALRIKKHIPYQDLFRLNSPTRSFAEVSGALLPYCHTTNDLFSLPAFPQLMSYRIVVTTCRDASILVEARVTNRDLAKLERGIINAMHFGGKQNDLKTSLHWNALLLDEAAQATEPEAGIPLSVVAPPDKGIIGDVQVVMAGDQYQLGPRLSSRGSALEMSLFERLFNRSIYRDHPLSRRLLKRSISIGIDEPIIRRPFANLFQNYRSHPAILAIPSALFYSDTLVPKATNTDCLSEWTGWRGRRWPVLFACNVGGDVRPLEGFGWSNRPEAKKACDFAKSLVDDGLLEERDICIMSPFRAQVKLLRDTIRSEPYKLRDVNIGPTETFQGLESRFVIICTTRTESRHLDEDHKEGLGIINQAKRFNVAMTRAKQGLIVIGNPWVLSKDNSWNAFIKFCLRHGLWEEDSEDSKSMGGSMHKDAAGSDVSGSLDTLAPQHISSLERGLVYAEEQAGKLPVTNKRSLITQEEDSMWVGGHAAEEAFYIYIDEKAQDRDGLPSIIPGMASCGLG